MPYSVALYVRGCASLVVSRRISVRLYTPIATHLWLDGGFLDLGRLIRLRGFVLVFLYACTPGAPPAGGAEGVAAEDSPAPALACVYASRAL